MRTANGIHGAMRARNGTSTPSRTCASARTASVTSTAPASSSSVAVSPAKLQSRSRCPDSNHVSWASGNVMRATFSRAS